MTLWNGFGALRVSRHPEVVPRASLGRATSNSRLTLGPIENPMSDPEYDVIIAGYGPVGATLANLLGMHGIRTLVLERDDGVYRLPRAGTCDDEVMRIWQNIGLADLLMPRFLPQHKVQFFDASGRPFLELLGGGFGYGYPALIFLYQPMLEEVLRDGVTRFPTVDVRLQHEVDSFEDLDDAVTVTGRDHRTGEAFRASAKYLVGCDGGRSIVRERLGIELNGVTFQRWLVLDAEVDDPAQLPGNFQYLCDPRRPAVTYPMALNHHRWQFMLNPDETKEEMETTEVAERLLAPWRGRGRIELIRKAVYVYHARLADRWRVGRVFLAGDAAHLTPPFAGQGMSSGIRDANNLAWKLALVLRGDAGQEIFDTYELERRPHVKRMTRLALSITSLLQTQSRALSFARDSFFRLLGSLPLIGPYVRRGEFKPSASFTAGLIAHGRRSSSRDARGTLLIQPTVLTSGGERRLLDDVLGKGFVVLGMDADPRQIIDDDTRSLWAALATRFVLVVPAGRSRPQPSDAVDVVSDPDGQLADWFRQHRVNVAVLRPDRFVFGVCDAGRPGAAHALGRALRHALHVRDTRNAGDAEIASYPTDDRARARATSGAAHAPRMTDEGSPRETR